MYSLYVKSVYVCENILRVKGLSVKDLLQQKIKQLKKKKRVTIIDLTDNTNFHKH